MARRNPGYDSPPRKQRERCPVEGCRKYKGTHNHVQPERSTERERFLRFVIEIPFYGSDEKAADTHLSLASHLHYSVIPGIRIAELQVWDEEELPEDAAEYYYAITPLVVFDQPTETLKEVG